MNLQKATFAENVNCNFDFPYEKKYNNFSLNHNDILGIKYIFLFIIIISLFFILTDNYILATFLLLIYIKNLYDNPLTLLTIPSAIITLFTRTPEILEKKDYFKNHNLFENKESFIKIKDEVNKILLLTNNGNNLPLISETYQGMNSYIGSDVKKYDNMTIGWRILNIKVGNTYTKDAINHFPFLVKILNQIPEVVSCVVSVLEPGVMIPMHVGYYKGTMRYMLPIIIPKDKDNVFLCVNGIKYIWEEGNGVLWDDTYPHKVYNNTNEIRVLLFMDVSRPYTGIGKIINDYFINLFTTSEVIKEEIKRTEIQVKI